MANSGNHYILLTVLAIRTVSVMTVRSDSVDDQPLHVHEGEDALLTCIVRDVPDNLAVIWKKEEQERQAKRVLTAGDMTVTADSRVRVLHDKGGDVWVLVIKGVKSTDGGTYTCEVNTNPVTRTFHTLVVLPTTILPPNATADGATDLSEDTYSKYPLKGEPPNPEVHDYTECCMEMNVSRSCFGFCSIKHILDGTTGQDPDACEHQFPLIVQCMADGRNHVPCCTRENIPDLCQDLCRGEYTQITDSIKSHYSCNVYTERTLACIAGGVEILPGPPRDVEVDAVNGTTMKIQWLLPKQNGDSVTEYIVNITRLRSFDENDLQEENSGVDSAGTLDARSDTTEELSPRSAIIKVHAPANSTQVVSLSPFTVYEVSVTSANVHGTSLPSVRVRVFTSQHGDDDKVVGPAPELPDVKSCCISRGVSHTSCVEKLCDPRLSGLEDITDLMVCAPWANTSFTCLVNGRDHTECCRERGLPPLCLDFCAANFTKLDYRHFRCLRYINDYSSCLLQGYGVLPGMPKEPKVLRLYPEIAIITWTPPDTLSDTISGYKLSYRSMDEVNSSYTRERVMRPPYVIAGLKASTDYEMYVAAMNEHGTGLPSNRIIFHTPSDTDLPVDKNEDVMGEEEESQYNVTACCVSARLKPQCLPLCDYDAKMSDVRKLARGCSTEFPKLVKCGAGGRNHGDCCRRRGVHETCLGLCVGVIDQPPLKIVLTCAAYIGNIVQCFEEGTGSLPGPVTELQATDVNDTSISLVWEPPTTSNNVTGYEVHYRRIDTLGTASPLPDEEETVSSDRSTSENKEVNVTAPPYVLTGLTTNAVYEIFVLSVNENGTSLPSSQLIVNASTSAFNGSAIPGLPSPPHSLAVSGHSVTWVSISWQPPQFAHHTETFKYKVHIRAPNETQFHSVETLSTALLLEDLRPNTKYVVYVTAENGKGESSHSETLVAWTDPAYPAFVEPPYVRPQHLMEGGSMTVLCIAMGLPLPTVSLYISGILIRQENTRHMVTVIYNITRDMDHIACYADNGYGAVMQSSRRISIGYGPSISAQAMTTTIRGDVVALECRVEAHPEPRMVFWQDSDGQELVIDDSGRYSFQTVTIPEEKDTYLMQLTIKSVEEEDARPYYCHAENTFGSQTLPLNLQIQKPVLSTTNISSCCVKQNVQATCMEACALYLDINAVINKAECIPDFHKLIRCAVDGFDHRSCCQQKGVPRRCLHWCRGGPDVPEGEFCLLSYTKQIVQCFVEAQARMLGPPLNLRVFAIGPESVQVSWDPPRKNATVAEQYRVIWQMDGSTATIQNDTRSTSIILDGMKQGMTYSFAVTAVNKDGNGMPTDPVTFTFSSKYVSSAISSANPQIIVAVGIILTLVVFGIVVGAAVWLFRRKRRLMLGMKTATAGVAFENPSYLRETSASVANDASRPSQGDGSRGRNGAQLNNGQHPECVSSQFVSTESSSGISQVPTTLNEDRKPGKEGFGFKRLKPDI